VGDAAANAGVLEACGNHQSRDETAVSEWRASRRSEVDRSRGESWYQ
jgi:hypothetical protein